VGQQNLLGFGRGEQQSNLAGAMQPSTPIADWLESIENGFGGRFGDIFVKEVRAVFDYHPLFFFSCCALV
jgi:hypothetical protein